MLGGAYGTVKRLALRLRLVHLYRHAALRDPRLPASALPPDWTGHRARQLFVKTYIALSNLADQAVGTSFGDDQGQLPASTDEIRSRIERLERE